MSEQKFEIDFFELSFLAEACIPPVPIARHSFWIKLIDIYYHQLTPDQREDLFYWITSEKRFSFENKDSRLFYDRYNPENTCDIVAGQNLYEDVFYHDGLFHTNSRCTIIEGDIEEMIGQPKEYMVPMGWKNKENIYDKDGHLQNMDVWNWIVTHDGKVRQITDDDMVDLHYTQIARFATEQEVLDYVNQELEKKFEPVRRFKSDAQS